jgi:hypothetical protein
VVEGPPRKETIMATIIGTYIGNALVAVGPLALTRRMGFGARFAAWTLAFLVALGTVQDLLR